EVGGDHGDRAAAEDADRRVRVYRRDPDLAPARREDVWTAAGALPRAVDRALRTDGRRRPEQVLAHRQAALPGLAVEAPDPVRERPAVRGGGPEGAAGEHLRGVPARSGREWGAHGERPQAVRGAD